MSRKLKAAMLGTAHAHALGKLRILRSSDDYELAGVCEPDAALRTQRQSDEAYAGVRWLSLDELLDDAAIELVAVEAGVSENLALARRAVDAGKHIHLDKPPGSNLTALRQLFDEAQRRHLVVQMGYMWRYNAGIELAINAARDGLLGDVYLVRGQASSDIPLARRPELARYPGGMMFELGCHLIDLVIAVLGAPDTVAAELRHDARSNDKLADNTLAVLRYPRALATVETCALQPEAFAQRHFEIYGDQGTVVVQPIEPPSVRLCLRRAHGSYRAGWQTVEVPNHARYVRDLADLARAVRERQPLAWSAQHDLDAQQTLLRACAAPAD